MINQEQEIKETFKEEHQNMPNPKLFNFESRYLAILGVYVLLATGVLSLLATLIVLPFATNNENLLYKITNSEKVVEEVMSDSLALGIIPIDVYNDYAVQFDEFVYVVYNLTDDRGNEYVFIINSYSNNLDLSGHGSFVELNEQENTFRFTSDTIQRILSGEIVTWETNNFNIRVLITHTDFSPLPTFVTNQDVINFVSNSNENLTPTGLLSGIISLLVYLMAFIPLFFISKPYLKDDFTSLKIDGTHVVPTAIGTSFLYVFAASIAAGVIVNLFAAAGISIPTSANQISIERIVFSMGAPFMIISAVFIGPVVEELVFRKAIFGVVNNRWIALTASSLLFGIIHVTDEIATGNITLILLTSLSYIASGAAFGYAYIKFNKNIWYPTIAHMLFNALSFIFIFTR